DTRPADDPPAGRRTCRGALPAQPRRSRAGFSSRWSLPQRVFPCHRFLWRTPPSPKCYSVSCCYLSLVVVDDLNAMTLLLLPGLIPRAVLLLLLPHHVAQRKEAGGVCVALGVLVGQARLRIIQRAALLFAGVDND